MRNGELNTDQQLEKATKKKRNGKIAPFPAELSPHPHLHRTHSLLSHFETVGIATQAETPSAQGTPQHQSVVAETMGMGRMTLRDRERRKQLQEEVTPPSTAARKVRSAAVTPRKPAVAVNTPVKKGLKEEQGEVEPLSPSKTKTKALTRPTATVVAGQQSEPSSQVTAVQVSDQNPIREPVPLFIPTIEPPTPAKNEVGGSGASMAELPAKPKIMLRFSRPTSPIPTGPSSHTTSDQIDSKPTSSLEVGDGHRSARSDLPSAGHHSTGSSVYQSLYPSLPSHFESRVPNMNIHREVGDDVRNG
jgi:histone deacetylase HOS3